MERIVKEKVEEMITFAKRNADSIRYNTVIDILKEKNDSLEDDVVSDVWYELEKQGIKVVRECDEDYQSNAIEPDVFIPADVNIGQKPINVYNLMERLENEEIDLAPGFQRHGNLWSLVNQSRLIESLMLKSRKKQSCQPDFPRLIDTQLWLNHQ